MKLKQYVKLIKNETIVFCLLIILTSCNSLTDFGNKTPEDLGKSVLQALKTNDNEMFQEYVYTMHEVNFMLSNNEKAIKNKKGILERFEEYNERLRKVDGEIKKQASQNGLNDWSNIEFSHLNYALNSDDISAKNTVLYFTNGEFLGSIRLRGIYKSDRGWFMAGVPKFGKYNRMPPSGIISN